MTLTDRGIVKEMTAAFLLGLMVFTFVLLMGKVLRLVELIVSKGIGILTVLQLFLYVLPYSLMVTIPMSALLATLVTFTRLAGDGEILALQSAGVSVTRLARPAVGFGLVASALTLAVTVWIMPISYHAFNNLLFKLIWRHVAVGLQEGIFNSDFEGLILYAEKLDTETSKLEGIFIVDNRDPGERRVIVARNGQFTSDPQNLRLELSLSQGSIHLSAAELAGRYRLLNFAQYNVRLDAGRTMPSPLQRPPSDKELTLAELDQRALELRAQGKNYHPPIVEFHKKLAIPFSCVLFAVVAVPLGSRLRKGGRGLSLMISVGSAMGYYMLLVGGEGLGNRGLLPEALAMWIPNLLIALGGSVLLLQAHCYPDTLRHALAWSGLVPRGRGQGG